MGLRGGCRIPTEAAGKEEWRMEGGSNMSLVGFWVGNMSLEERGEGKGDCLGDDLTGQFVLWLVSHG